MTDIDMDDLREKAAKATPGPWEAVEEPLAVRGPREPWDKGRGLARLALMQMPWRAERMRANAEYIAAANPTIVLALIERVEKAERERDAARVSAERDALAEKVERVRGLIDWHETKAEKAQRYPGPDPIEQRRMSKAAQVHDDAAYRLRTALDGTEEVSGDE